MSDVETPQVMSPDAITDGLLDEAALSGGGGAFWEPPKGSFRLQFLGLEAGPTTKQKDDKTGETKEVATARWSFGVYTLMRGDPVMFEVLDSEGNETGEQRHATVDPLSSKRVTPRSKAGEWLTALLRRDIDFENEKTVDLVREALGSWAVGAFKPGRQNKDRNVLSELTPFDSE